MIIGLTGGYCSGKNQAAAILEKKGFRVIDVDLLGHRALDICAPKLFETFGEGIRKPGGGVDRKALGAIVFSDPAKLRLHESIVHPVMLSLLDEEIAACAKGPFRGACINAALLYMFPCAQDCDFILEIRSSLAERFKRGKARDGLGVPAVLKRIASQRRLWRLRPGIRPPIVPVRNSGSLEELEARIGAILKERGAG